MYVRSTRYYLRDYTFYSFESVYMYTCRPICVFVIVIVAVTTVVCC